MAVDSTKSIAENRQKYAQYFDQKAKEDFSMDNFFALLMAEMSNQDPMEPMSNTEFISQLANFTALKAQQDALYYQNANYAQSLVGKTVTVASVKGSEFYTDNGIVTSMSLSEGQFMVKVNGKDYPLTNIMEVMPSTNPYNLTANDGSYATSLIGKQVTVMTTNAEGKQIVETGTVSHIEVKDSQANVVINGMAYLLESVVKVEAENAKASEAAGADWAYATSLIGKQVTVNDTDEDGIKTTDKGTVKYVELVNNKINIIIDESTYPLSSVVKVEEAP